MAGLFALMCLIWGTTWLAMKVGVAAVPPLFFGGTRFVVAGLVLMGLAVVRGEVRRLTHAETGRLVLMQLLMIVLTYGPLFWAIKHVPSGLTAVLELALTPVSLLGFGILLGEERWTSRRAAALALGFVGLAVLFGPRAALPGDRASFLGIVAIVFSAIVYCLGTVLARPLTTSTGAFYLSGLTLMPGGLVLTLGSLALEPGAREAAALDWPLAVWAGWLFLVVFGSLIAFTVFLRLIAAWGPARAGSYAYVSPIIAVLLGVLVLHEHVGWRDGLGMGLLLAAAFASLGAPPREPARATLGMSCPLQPRMVTGDE